MLNYLDPVFFSNVVIYLTSLINFIVYLKFLNLKIVPMHEGINRFNICSG